MNGFLCADLVSRNGVRLRGGSQCGTSLTQGGTCGGPVDYRSGETYGVCAND